jgi:hypothetical protein
MRAAIGGGRARELEVPAEVATRSLHPQRWFMDMTTGRTWELTVDDFKPLTLPESLKAFLPKPAKN